MSEKQSANSPGNGEDVIIGPPAGGVDGAIVHLLYSLWGGDGQGGRGQGPASSRLKRTGALTMLDYCVRQTFLRPILFSSVNLLRLR